jgi:hypothetical protein
LPCGHPGRASHGGDVVAIERPTPRVAGARLKGRWVFSLGGAHEAGAGAPARLGVRASAAPAVPSPVAHRAHAWGGGARYKRRKKGHQDWLTRGPRLAAGEKRRKGCWASWAARLGC